MAESLGSVGSAGGGAAGGVGGAAGSVGGIGGVLQGTVQGALNKGKSFVDNMLPPERRADLWARFNKFATERPKFAAFLLSHIAISGLPLGLFVLMTITIALFSIITALLVAVLAAVLFIVFAVGVALVFLLPTLFFTTMVATFIFLWGVGGYYILKWFNEKKIPGIHTPFVQGMKDEVLGPLQGNIEASTGQSLGALNPDASKAKDDEDDEGEDEGEGEGAGEGGKTRKEGGKARREGKSQNGEAKGKSTGAEHHQNGEAKASKRQQGGKGQGEGVKSNATDATDGVKNKEIPKLAT